jgi:hypothetical protein
VDCTDFQIPFFGRKFHSHKYKFGSTIRYEVAVCNLSGDLVWINGPHQPGIWNDLAIFRNALLTELDEGERVEADDGYRGESPRYVKCPASIGSRKEMETAAAFVRRRHETMNKRFKQWGILKQVYRGDVGEEGNCNTTYNLLIEDFLTASRIFVNLRLALGTKLARNNRKDCMKLLSS